LAPQIQKRKTAKHEDSEEELTKEELARIKQLEKGRQGFSPLELNKIKYKDNVEELYKIGVPYNPKLDGQQPA